MSTPSETFRRTVTVVMLLASVRKRRRKVDRVKTAQQAAQNWQASAGRAAADYTAGVQGYSGDWAGATTSQQSVMLANVNEAITSGRWAQGVQRAAATWKADTVAKAQNYSMGFQAGASKQAASAQKIMGALNNIVPGLPARGSFSQNLARANSLATELHALKGQLGA